MLSKSCLAGVLFLATAVCGMQIFPNNTEVGQKAEVALSYALGGFDDAINNQTVTDEVKGKLQKHMDAIIAAARTKDLAAKVKALTDKLKPAKDYIDTVVKDKATDEKLKSLLTLTAGLIGGLLKGLPQLLTAKA